MASIRGDVESLATISQWAYLQAQAEVECPHCHAAAGRTCQSVPNGHRRSIHYCRIDAYRTRIGPDEFTRRHGGRR